MAHPNPRAAGIGRKKGTGNKATAAAREAMAAYVEGNVGRLQEWLNMVAYGVRDEETGKWVILPNPAKAFGMFQSVLEFHIPKLSRIDRVPESEVLTKTINVRFIRPTGQGDLADLDGGQ